MRARKKHYFFFIRRLNDFKSDFYDYYRYLVFIFEIFKGTASSAFEGNANKPKE